MKKVLFVAIYLVLAKPGWNQGCVAIRNVGGISPNLLFKNIQPQDKWILSINNRYFEATRSYKGDQFITDTLVRNKIYTLNISMLRILSNGWSVQAYMPVLANARRNSNDHGGPKTPKHTTHSFGLGDLRLSVYKWLLNTSNSKGNIEVGLGVKLPTGDYRFEDYFYRNDTTKVVAPVDQAIQLGDGGTGFTTELQAYYSIIKTINVFIQGYYLINPREQNGVSNLKGRAPTEFEIANSTTVMSVPDQYTFRGGANYQLKQITVAASIKYEKVPVNDLIGGNKGFRRAASISSAETEVTYAEKKALFFVNLGFPFKCNIIQNTQNNMTPAGFTNFVATFGMSFKL